MEITPAIEVVHQQGDGRYFLLYDGIVVGLITVERDEPMSDDGRRIGLVAQAIKYGNFRARAEGGRYIDTSISGRSAMTFATEAEYIAWLGAEKNEGRH